MKFIATERGFIALSQVVNIAFCHDVKTVRLYTTGDGYEFCSTLKSVERLIELQKDLREFLSDTYATVFDWPKDVDSKWRRLNQ